MTLALWADGGPSTLDECDCHGDVQEQLLRLGARRDIPHMILYGPSGSGKQTRIRALLKAVFGDNAGKIRSESITMEKSGFIFETMQSQFHTEVYASDLGFKDRQCIQLVIKNLASTYSAATLLGEKQEKRPEYRVFVIQEAHALSMPAQAALRRTMERFSGTARVVLLTEKLSGIIEPLKSRCVCIRVPSPSIPEVVSVLQKTAVKAIGEPSTSQRPSRVERAPDVSSDTALLEAIAVASNRNLRVAIILLQKALKSTRPTSASNLEKLKPKWKQVIDDICNKVRKAPTAQTMLDVRDDLAHMIVVCIPGQDILEALALNFLSHESSPQVLEAILAAAAHYSHNMLQGSKELLFLETFVQTVACTWKR
eukprot:Protomagalhaensia_sp_Gyna_25__2828@NODE_263_length_4136_cov_33_415182_g204_i0_p2_GENE_NODE_263_length_4136_cov_33_415182_g204_i0NODE_263_length_4136_cov_33_415182_g204_i0_p2_ORF_typecomplete_len369_score48_11DNA_pol3_delta2/PF13177_6/1e25RuvB_N/PF05496_12/0_00095RuvB_N/PF05496_12/3_4RuvB_N/PF05496_12/3e03Rad17/PF03215_15/1_6e05AAA/PF00004_29/0_00036AAA/PF00004_29/4_1e03AAA_30/PF13604_6/0_00068AAA_22/PF13401_6/0_0028AAA_22/PF13401_6/1_4e03Flavi_DEAD/PF07652_14/0_0087Sigma54_activ_2/PF14532_6/0_04